ncbi:hatching enzyme 1.2-like [Phlebotomus papatasi]|uniref:hatching enzyme 1.2-like n=1 Tax=Phlebotomus papatasi TaxID=29031 RepID=UPI002483CDE7|nr:hatching enzyme 1.2-like [Phlebotomus papatasi]
MESTSDDFLLLLLIILCGSSAQELEQSEEKVIDLSHYGAMLYGNPSTVNGRRLDRWRKASEKGNPEEQGAYVEGDILIPSTHVRNGLRSQSSYWPSGIVPLEVIGPFSNSDIQVIQAAINSYHSYTCISFVERQASHRDYVSIQNTGTGCWSSVGRIGGGQIVNLQSPGCTVKVGTVIHELMHAIGFLHEQNREDRNNYVQILTDNIQFGFEADFQPAASGSTNDFGVAYDYSSVMHYSSTAFSKNGLPTIVPVLPFTGEMGQREGFAESDVAKIRRMYSCPGQDTQQGTEEVLGDVWAMIFSPPRGKRQIRRRIHLKKSLKKKQSIAISLSSPTTISRVKSLKIKLP